MMRALIYAARVVLAAYFFGVAVAQHECRVGWLVAVRLCVLALRLLAPAG